MSLLVPEASQQTILRRILDQDLILGLYVNSKTPSLSDVAANYTEMVGLGYTPKILAAEGWIYLPEIPAKAIYPAQTWTWQAGGPIKVYGYFILQALDRLLLWAERFFPAGTLPIDYFLEGQIEGSQLVLGKDLYPIQCTLGNVR